MFSKEGKRQLERPVSKRDDTQLRCAYCRIVEVDKGPWACLVQPPCSQQGHLEQVVQGCGQLHFERLQGCSTTFVVTLLHCLIMLTRFWVFFKWQFPYFNLCPLLFLGTTLKSLEPSLV